MTEPTRLPTTVTGGAALAAAVVATGAAALGSTTALGIGALGIAVLWAAITRGTTFAFDLGPFVVFVAVLQTGVATGSILLTLVGAVAAVLAWDLGHTARDLGRQLGQEANTVRLEVARILASLSVGVLSAGIGYAIVSVVTTGESNAALVALVVAVFFATVALGTGERQVRQAEV